MDIALIIVERHLYHVLVLGALVASFGGMIILTPIMHLVFKSIGDGGQSETHFLAAAVGLIERAFYSVAVCLGAHVMIGGWLVLKAFSNLDGSERRNLRSFYIYLLGNIISLSIGGAVGLSMMLYIISKNSP